ncbi:MAG: restriction endonuclease subunit S, partial [Thermoguttaceae bacterium]|nr:restriction endonuclease subunit S [Thermoguttaceae bacterium]
MDVRDGTHDSPKYLPEGIPLVTSKNLVEGRIDFSNVKYISLKDHESISERSNVCIGDILFAMIGSIGNPVIVSDSRTFSIKNMALFKRIGDSLLTKYVYWFLLSEQRTMRRYATGGVQSFVSLNYLRTYLIPIPPLNEQIRIVSKIETLLPLVESYGKRQVELDDLNATFPEALKKSILQEAIQGRLVEQDPNDEPASVLLERIREEKERL